MNRTAAFLSVLAAFACLAASCGGKVAFDGTQSSESTSGSTSASTGATSSSASSAASSSGVSACDSTAHTLDPADYNLDCTQASDCTNVFLGDFCMGCVCAFSAINVGDLAKYKDDAQQKAAGAPPSICNCPASSASCTQGKCTGSVP